MITPPHAGSYSTVSNGPSNRSLNTSTHALGWSIPWTSTNERSGTIEYGASVGGDDTGPCQGSLCGAGGFGWNRGGEETRVNRGEEGVFSSDAVVGADEYAVL